MAVVPLSTGLKKRSAEDYVRRFAGLVDLLNPTDKPPEAKA